MVINELVIKIKLRNIIILQNQTEKELETFIESMTTQNLEEVGTFFETMPKLIHIVKTKNPKTKKKVEIPIEGLQSFFG